MTSSPFFASFAQSDLFGKFIFLALFSLSMLSWCALINKWRQNKEVSLQGDNFRKRFKKDSADLFQVPLDKVSHPFLELYLSLVEQAKALLEKNLQFQKVKSEGTCLTDSDIDMLSAHLGTHIHVKAKQLQSQLFILSTVVTLAPFLGLLGTVWGILLTFSGLQGSANALSNEEVLTGLSLALTTTVLGLLVAIPALVGYNYLKAQAQDIESDMLDFSNEMLQTLELQYRQVTL